MAPKGPSQARAGRPRPGGQPRRRRPRRRSRRRSPGRRTRATQFRFAQPTNPSSSERIQMHVLP